MGVFFIYILKSSVCLVLFYLFFRLLLSKETFHRFNRMALLGVLFFSLLIPCIEVTTRHQVEVQQAMLSIEQLLLMAELEATPVEAGAVQETVASWIQIVLLVYLAGILFLACRSIYSLISLFRLIHSGKQEKLEKGVMLVVHHHEIAPFSWMKYIYSMANSFNHSKLKKRITMMLKEKSNPWARLKYLYVLPLAAIAVTAFARPEISEKMEEISVAKVNDLAAIVEKKSEENVVKEPADTAKNKVIVVGYRAEKKDSVLTSGEKKVALSVREVSGEEKPLVIINGKESDYEVVNALNPERIESISVIGAEKAIKIYGEKAKDGLMDIKLYSEKKFKPKKIEVGSLNKTRLDALNSGAKNWGVTFHSATGGKPLIIIDGKEAFGDDPLANISPDRIRSISVLKDKNALAAYGDKGKNGVIEVNLLVKEEYQVRQIPIRTVNDTVTSTIKTTVSEE